jgi:hypothetical protein
VILKALPGIVLSNPERINDRTSKLSSFLQKKLDKQKILVYYCNMKTSSTIASAIDRLPKGYVFTYTDLMDDVTQREAVIKALNRMVQAGRIDKLSKGRYYKPEPTVFGNLRPELSQIVKDLLEKDGKVIGYLTGYSIYNQLGLTTQVSNTIQVGKNEIRPKFKRERYTIAFIKQKNTITKENIPLLQILDAIRYIKKIPDASLEQSAIRLLAIIKSITDQDKRLMVRLSLKYPAATRALLGALLDELKDDSLTVILFKSLNPITKYKFAGISKTLNITNKWNIL